jgi:putative nucleotidyltransferase with HDIG domain
LANFDFEYVSNIRTKERKEQRKQSVSPVYRIDLSAFQEFNRRIDLLKQHIDKAAKQPAEQTQEVLQTVVDEFGKYNLALQTNDLQTLMHLPEIQRNRFLEEGLFILREISQKGIYDENDGDTVSHPHFFGLDNDHVSNATIKLQSKGNALRILRMNLWTIDMDYEVANALVHILKFGLIPNFVYDKEKTDARIKEFVESTSPVVVKVSAGDPLIENGQVATPDIYEKLAAYQKQLKYNEGYVFRSEHAAFSRSFFTLLVLASLVLGILLLPTRMKRSGRCLSAAALVLLINIGCVRLTNGLCTTPLFGHHHLFLSLIPYMAPTFLGSLLATTLIDPTAGVLMSLGVSMIHALIQNNGFDRFPYDLLGTITAVYLCRHVRLREGLFKAALGASLWSTMGLLVHGLLSQHMGTNQVLQQGIASLGNGLLSAILALAFLPLLEKLFRYTTDITFLKLTDYNHPLLRKLQLICPGTYHHSLMVANLSEQMALEVGANALLCRCCALYHDIGKMVKPEYFSENQNESETSHEGHTCSISALILKSHVREGIEIAKTYRLPKVVMDIIRQHHGTSLMQYFYQKALRQRDPENSPEIEAAAFRYDGPKPQFRESAVISLADSIEAASRSLTRITPQTVKELVEDIVNDRMADHQLGECNLTFKDLEKIKEKSQFVLLTMLHSRVRYPKVKL